MNTQSYLYACELRRGVDVTFNPFKDSPPGIFEHKLEINSAYVDFFNTPNEMHQVEVEVAGYNNQKFTAVLATILRPNTQPSVVAGSFTVTGPVRFRLTGLGPGPIHLLGRHHVCEK